MAARRDLPDLPALVRRRRRRRRRRPGGHRARSSTTSRRCAVEAIWLSPFFPSPMADFGYDVADYCDVDPVFGTLADFDALIAACHARGIRVVHRLGAQPHVRPASVVRRVARPSRDEPEARLVRLARPAPGRRAAERLGRRTFRRVGAAWTLRRADRPVLPALVPAPAARPQLGQPGGRGGDARRAALLAGARRRRLPARRDREDRQGPAAARQHRRAPPPRRGLGHDPRAPARDPPRRRRATRTA